MPPFLNEFAELGRKLCADGVLVNSLVQATEIITAGLQSGHKLLIAGNGGSASQASHFAGELVGRYKKERRGLPAIALSADTSVLTAWSNDYDYASVFARQVEALGQEGDILAVLTTSGNSENIIKAIEQAKVQKLITICFLGKGGGKLKGQCDVELIVPSDNTPRIQEAHLLFIHSICEQVEEILTLAKVS